MGHARDFRESHRRNVGSRYAEAACLVGDILFVHLQQARSDALCLVDNPFCTDVNARSTNGHRARVEGTVAGLNLPRIPLHNVDILDWHLHDIGGDLCQRRDVAMTLTHGARIDGRAAARVHADARTLPAAAVEADRPQSARWRHAAHMRVRGDADAAVTALATQFVAFADALCIVESLHRPFEAALVISAIVNDGRAVVRFVWKIGSLNEILTP